MSHACVSGRPYHRSASRRRMEDGVGFSTIEVGDKHAGPSGLGDLEVPEYHRCTSRAVNALEREDPGRRIR